MYAINNNEINEKYIFIDGPGGSGKSFLYNVIINILEKSKIHYLAVAWTGIAANLLYNGKTVHSAFKLSIDINEDTIANININSVYAMFLREVKIILWDEISMTSKLAFEAVNRILIDICRNDEIFGGKVVILSGDFRQILPIVRNGSRIDIINMCIKNSYLWSYFNSYKLYDNMRLTENDTNFKKWLLDVGNGIMNTRFENENDLKLIPNELIVKDDLITEIFGSFIKSNDLNFREKVILAPTNDDVCMLNDEILFRLEGDVMEYYSSDTLNHDVLKDCIPLEFLNSLNPNGLPLHKLLLKTGCIVMLLRNLNIKNGLCNGTRLKIKSLKKYVIVAELITGTHKGNIVALPRIDLSPLLHEVPFSMIRRQFPIKLAASMTINKSQGQSFNNVGIYLSSPVFTHGQLYVALSRTTSKKNLKIKLTEKSIEYEIQKGKKKKKNTKKVYTKNIVYEEVVHM